MGVRKNPDTGEIIEEPTRRFEDSRAREPETNPRRPPPRGGSDAPTVEAPAGGSRPGRARGGGSTAFEARTVPYTEGQRAGPAETQEGRTVLHRPGSRTPAAAPVEARAEVRAESSDGMADPVVGWLVVVAGPGKGQVCKLGYGTNSLGRGENARARLDYGDEGISRENHAALTYDPRGRKFYLQHGGGVNLTYLGDTPVLTPTPLAPMQDISIGDTTLRFVPFCGPDFDWQDLGS